MACANCIRSVEQGALALFELAMLHGDELPAGTDWRAVANQLRDLVRHLTAGPTTGNEDGGNA